MAILSALKLSLSLTLSLSLPVLPDGNRGQNPPSAIDRHLLLRRCASPPDAFHCRRLLIPSAAAYLVPPLHRAGFPAGRPYHGDVFRGRASPARGRPWPGACRRFRSNQLAGYLPAFAFVHDEQAAGSARLPWPVASAQADNSRLGVRQKQEINGLPLGVLRRGLAGSRLPADGSDELAGLHLAGPGTPGRLVRGRRSAGDKGVSCTARGITSRWTAVAGDEPPHALRSGSRTAAAGARRVR